MSIPESNLVQLDPDTYSVLKDAAARVHRSISYQFNVITPQDLRRVAGSRHQCPSVGSPEA